MYLNQVSQQNPLPNSLAHQHDPYSVAALQQQQQQVLAAQQAALYGGDALDNAVQANHNGLNGVNTSVAASTMGGLLAPTSALSAVQRSQHARAVSLPVFSGAPQSNGFQQQVPHHGQQHSQSGFMGMNSGFGGFGGGGIGAYGLAIQGDGGLQGWAEE